jgi:hypothetical protein
MKGNLSNMTTWGKNTSGSCDSYVVDLPKFRTRCTSFKFIRVKQSLAVALLGSCIYLPMGPRTVVLYMVPCSFYFYLLQKFSAQQILERYLKMFERFSLLF